MRSINSFSYICTVYIVYKYIDLRTHVRWAHMEAGHLADMWIIPMHL